MDKEKKIYAEISAVIAFFSIFPLVTCEILNGKPLLDKLGLFSFILYLILAYLLYSAIRMVSIREIVIGGLFSGILSFLYITAYIFHRTERVPWNDLGLYKVCAGAAILFWAVYIWLTRWIDERKFNIKSILGKICRKYGIFIRSKKSVVLTSCILFLFWTPAFLAVFPGVYSYDASVQVGQIFIEHQLSAHHPVLHTLFLNGMLMIGEVLFDSYNAGLVIHSLVQGLIVGFIIAYACCYIEKFCVPKIVQAGLFLFFACNPIIQILVFTTTKDTLFGAVFLLLIVYTADMLLYPEEFIASHFQKIRYIIVIILMCLLRNQGVYILVICTPFFVFSLRKYWKKILGIFVLSIGIVEVLLSPVSNIAGVEKGDIREMLSVPMQQLACVYNSDERNITGEEADAIEEIIEVDHLHTYFAQNADPVKSGFQTDVLLSDPVKYLKTYLSVGVKNKKMYLDAFYALAYGNWYIDENIYWEDLIYYDGAFMESYFNVLGIERNTLLPIYDEYLRDIVYEDSYENVPIISLLLQQALPFWIMMFCGGYLLIRREYHRSLVLLPILGYWGTLLLGPVVNIRYCFPMICCVPIMAAMIFSSRVSEKTKLNSRIEA